MEESALLCRYEKQQKEHNHRRKIQLPPCLICFLSKWLWGLLGTFNLFFNWYYLFLFGCRSRLFFWFCNLCSSTLHHVLPLELLGTWYFFILMFTFWLDVKLYASCCLFGCRSKSIVYGICIMFLTWKWWCPNYIYLQSHQNLYDYLILE